MKKPLEIFAAFIVITCLGYSTIPYLQEYKGQKDSQKSLQSLRNAYTALKIYETDHNQLPPPEKWVEALQPLTKKLPIEDPLYREITQIDQPYNPGWGFNTRMALRLELSSPKNTPEKLHTSHYPDNTILLAPSHNPTITPLTNGELLPEPLSARNPTLTDHRRRLGQLLNREGTSGLYLFTSGDIQQLSPEKSQEVLKLQTAPHKPPTLTLPSITTESTPWNTPPNGKNTWTIQTSPLLSELIPIKNPSIKKLELPYITEIPGEFEIQIIPYNQHRLPINTTGPIKTTLKEIYAGNGNIVFTKPLPNGSKLGFSPLEGYLTNPFQLRDGRAKQKTPDGPWEFENVKAHYQKGTPIGEWVNTSITYPVKTTTTQWRQKTLLSPATNLPIETEFIQIEIRPKPPTKIQVKPPKITLQQ